MRETIFILLPVLGVCFPDVASGKNLPANAGEKTRVPSLCREDPLENEMPILLQYSCLENPMDRGACRATVHWVTKSGKTEVT